VGVNRTANMRSGCFLLFWKPIWECNWAVKTALWVCRSFFRDRNDVSLYGIVFIVFRYL